MSTSTPEEPAPEKFEARLKALESIVETLENDMPPLEAALSSYEEGVTIARACLDQLDKAELRIRTLNRED